MLPQVIHCRLQGNIGGFCQGVTIDPRTDGGKGDALQLSGGSELQALQIGAPQQVGLSSPSSLVNRPDGMDNVLRLQGPSGGCLLYTSPSPRD